MELPVVEKNISIPPPKFKHQNNLRYGLDRLEIGDSILIENQTQIGFMGTKKWHEKKYNRKLVTRKVGEGIRVWRIK